MSDEDDFMSEESYEFEFEDEDDQEEQELISSIDNDKSSSYEVVSIGFDRHLDQLLTNVKETDYYSAKSIKEDDPAAAISYLKNITNHVESGENYDWAFKAYKQMMKIHFSLREHNEVIDNLEKLIELSSKINSLYLEESLSRILTRYSTSSHEQFVQSLYSILSSFVSSVKWEKSDNLSRLWFKINLNKLNRHLEREEFDSCPRLINLIAEKLETLPPPAKNAFLLELNVAKIQFYSYSPNPDFKILNTIYRNCMEIITTFTHPRLMGIIKECGGKVFFHRGNFEKARLEFYECFKNYDEAGLSSKKKILKYLTLCSILTENEVNPFESPETQIYSSLPEYSDLLDLIKYYSIPNLDRFSNVLARMINNNDPLSNDDIFKIATTQILNNLREKILENLVFSFRSIRLDYLEKKLGVDRNVVERMLIKLFSEGKVVGISVDFVEGYVENNSLKGSILPTDIDPNDINLNVKISNDIKANLILDKTSNTSDNMDIDHEAIINTGIVVEDARTLQECELGQNSSNTACEQVERSDHLFCNLRQTLRYMGFGYRSGLKRDLGLIDYWFSDLSSAIPPVVRHELSQKDQVFLEQKAETVNPKNVPSNFADKKSATLFSAITDFQISDSNQSRSVAVAKTIRDLNAQLEKIISVQYWKRDDEVS